MNPKPEKILSMIGQYWDIAYQQGSEGRTTDNEAGDAQRVLSEITAALALLPGEPVAVMWVDSTGCEHVTTDVDRGKVAAAAWGYDVSHLYTSPTPHPSLDREGLLEEARAENAELRQRLATAYNVKAECNDDANAERRRRIETEVLLEEARMVLELAQALANQIRAVLYHLNGQAYSSTLTAMNAFDAANLRLSKLEGSSHAKA